MNLILEKTEKMEFFTDLRVLFYAFKNLQLKYNWLITDLECNFYPDPLCVGRDLFWLSGAELTNLVNQHSIQFIWAVFSGFLPEEEIDLKKLNIIPYADGNSNLWSLTPSIQHPNAKIEIVCWDSACTLLLSKDEEIAKNFNDFFPEAEVLEKHNFRYAR